MKNSECKPCHHVAWGVLISLFGVFLLAANFMPDTNLMKFWPLFVVAAGVYKLTCGCCWKHKH